jgi:hypothetical protein
VRTPPKRIAAMDAWIANGFERVMAAHRLLCLGHTPRKGRTQMLATYLVALFAMAFAAASALTLIYLVNRLDSETKPSSRDQTVTYPDRAA